MMQKVDYHNPVLKKEAVDGLHVNPDGIYVDVTFGGGGHSRSILEKLSKKGRLIAFDQDLDAFDNVPQDDRLYLLRQNFRFLKNNLKYHGYLQIDGLLADLGVSSHQFDEAERGFSFRMESGLDMRMNQRASRTAAQILNEYSREHLMEIFRNYGELNNAGKLATKIVQYRENERIEHNKQFTSAIADLIPKKIENQYLAKVYQALRIEVNSELQALKQMLMQCVEVIKPGGRLVVISYHSLEDRLVKNFMKSGNFEGKVDKDLYGNFYAPFKLVSNKVIVPGEKEIETNNRARSAKMRIAEKV